MQGWFLNGLYETWPQSDRLWPSLLKDRAALRLCQVSTAAERHSSAPSLLLCHLHTGAAQGPVSWLGCTTEPVLLLPGNHACMVLKWDAFLVAPPSRRSLSPPPAPAGSGNLCRHTFLAQHFVAPLQAASPCLLTCLGKLHLGLTGTFWSGCSRAAEWSFLARKVSLNQVRGHVRSSQQRDYSPGGAQPHPAKPEPVLCTKHRKELYSYRFVS